jgi:hypothetical protein
MGIVGRWAWLATLLLVSLPAWPEEFGAAAAENPLFREFMGLNGHTIQFFAYEYIRGDDPRLRIWVVWSPTGMGVQRPVDLKIEGMKLLTTERMPLAAGEAPVEHPIIRDKTISLVCTESPLFLQWNVDLTVKWNCD